MALASVFEMALGAWVVFGLWPRQTWRTLLVLFALFAVIAFQQALTGRSSCPCFGFVATHPAATAAFDASVVALLLAFRPRPRADVADGQAPASGPIEFLSWQWVVGVLAVAICALSATSAIGAWQFGSVQTALAYARGDRLLFSPMEVNLGSGAPGERREVVVLIENLTGKDVHVLGMRKSCGDGISDFSSVAPVIARGAREKLAVTVEFPNHSGRFSQSVLMFSDCAQKQPSAIAFYGIVGELVPGK